MSMLTYLPGGVPLPMGDFITPPDMIYNNYAAYKQSKDFAETKPESILVSPPYGFVEKLHDTNYPVHVYRKNSTPYALSINEYDKDHPPSRRLPAFGASEVPQEVQEQDVFDQDVTKQFSLPYIYYLGFCPGEMALREYLCAVLKPRDKAELYECWACTEREERDKTWDQTVDLQKFIDSGEITVPTSKYAEEAEKRFVTYNATLTSNIAFNYVDRERNVIMISTHIGGQYQEYIPYSLAEETLGKYRGN